MTSLVWAAIALVGLFAASAFGLVLVLARRLRALTEHVHKFLPISELGLPDPGTPLPAFQATTAAGVVVSEKDFGGTDRLLAFLTTDCGSCHDQVAALRDLPASEWPPPIAVIIGPPADRAAMIAKLGEDAIVVEEDEHGPIAEAFDMHEFPAVLVAGDGVVRAAGHGVAGVLAAAASGAHTA